MAAAPEFTPYAAGRKFYGMGRSFPTAGKVDPMGYKTRDLAANTRKNAVMRRLKSLQSGRIMQPDVLRSL